MIAISLILIYMVTAALFESLAINLYLAKTYGGALYPADRGGEAQAWQWSVWAISEIEPSAAAGSRALRASRSWLRPASSSDMA